MCQLRTPCSLRSREVCWLGLWNSVISKGLTSWAVTADSRLLLPHFKWHWCLISALPQLRRAQFSPLLPRTPKFKWVSVGVGSCVCFGDVGGNGSLYSNADMEPPFIKHSFDSYRRIHSPSTPHNICLLSRSLQSCPTLCDAMDHSPLGSPIREILQARILEWVAIPSSRESSQPRDRTHISYIFCIGRKVLYN